MKRIILTMVLTVMSLNAYVTVDGYYRSNGTYVEPYTRSNPDNNPYNNINTYR